MAFSKWKIDKFTVSIAMLPDRVSNSATWLKRQFDARTDQIQAAFNGLIDELDNADLASKTWVKNEVSSSLTTQQASFGSGSVAAGAVSTLTTTVQAPAGYKVIGAWPGMSGHPAVSCTGMLVSVGTAGATLSATFYNATPATAAIDPQATVLLVKNNT